jgi:RHS repeat-associated protein
VNDGGGNVPFSYDKNGNLLNDGTRAYEWDALNRLKRVYKDPSGTPTLIGAYDYDALNRRIRKVITNGGLSGTITNGTTDFIYNSDWQCVEERDGSNDPTKQYVWGIYIDELLQQRVDVSGTPARQYPLQDLLYRTTALTDEAGAIVEAYDCDAYGNTLIFDTAGTGGNWWADDASQADEPTCDFIFTGRRLDAESGLLCLRNRFYLPSCGRFIIQDPLDYDAMDVNLYRYVHNNPLRSTDPLGLESCDKAQEGQLRGVASATVFALGNQDPDSADATLNFIILVALLGDIPVPKATDIGELIDKVINPGRPWGLDVAAKAAELKEFDVALRLHQGIVSAWTKLQCQKCTCTTWFSGWPVYRKKKHFEWVATGAARWVQCDLSRTVWGAMNKNRAVYIDKDMLFLRLLGRDAPDTLKAQCEKQALQLCEER